MPGGPRAAYAAVEHILNDIAARAPDGSPCVTYIGPRGAGHYVKMVHNGIEYGDMQLIAEAYHLLSGYLELRPDEAANVFSGWNKTELDSYLIQITAEILAHKDVDGQPLLDKILDTAGQKGTGKWTVMSAAELGQPATTITEAVYARAVSALKDQRLTAA